MASSDWSALIRKKLSARDACIPSEWKLPDTITSQAHRNSRISASSLLAESNLLTDRDRHLTEDYDATALIEAMATGELTSLEVTEAFCKRAAVAHQLLNPLTEIFFDKALKRAQECDAYLTMTGKPMGPFHGLPISLKDSFMIEGEFSTMGFVSFLQKRAAAKNSPIVDILLDGGAVLYCKTTVPQTLLIPFSGQQDFFRPGWPGVLPAAGPHAHSARDLTLLCKNVMQVDWDRDSTVLYSPWRELEKKRGLTLGLWLGVDEVLLTQPISRALREAARALRAAGHEVEEFTTPTGAGFGPIVDAYTKSFSLDTNNTVLGYIQAGEEELIPPVAETFAILSDVASPSLDTVWEINGSLENLQRSWHGDFRRFDAILCPGHHSPGAVHGKYGFPFYTAVWNLLNCPASVMPFSKVESRLFPSPDDYDAEMMEGITCGIQVVGWTGQDEEVLMATEMIAEALGCYSPSMI